MFNWQIAARMLNTASLFMCFGMGVCIKTLSMSGAFAGLLWGYSEGQRGNWQFIWAVVLLGAVYAAVLGAISGFVWGSGVFYLIGLWRGMRPGDNPEHEVDRCCDAARCAAFYCGVAAFLTGLPIVLWQVPLQVIKGWFGVVYYSSLFLILGNLLGVAVGALSPGSIERVREIIKSSMRRA